MKRAIRQGLSVTFAFLALATPALARESYDCSWSSGGCLHVVRQSDDYGGSWNYWMNCSNGSSTYDMGSGYHTISPNASCNWN